MNQALVGIIFGLLMLVVWVFIKGGTSEEQPKPKDKDEK